MARRVDTRVTSSLTILAVSTCLAPCSCLNSGGQLRKSEPWPFQICKLPTTCCIFQSSVARRLSTGQQSTGPLFLAFRPPLDSLHRGARPRTYRLARDTQWQCTSLHLASRPSAGPYHPRSPG
ncbi:hypothetical protein LY78DRAFT_338307 [Colletotrichum sublineola]|nr:hypothetical protein LY78DRAFT_338307 [Colletotrichum sublineola]